MSSSLTMAQEKRPAQKATVILDNAMVYQSADFDAPVIAQLRRGNTYFISNQKWGPFFRIQLKPGTLGYIADVDVKVGGTSSPSLTSSSRKAEKSKTKKVAEKPAGPRKPFLFRRYRGPVLEVINYAEATMGDTRTSTMNFYGVRWSGFNTVFDGEIFTDANIVGAITAPSYYEKITGNATSGWILNMNFLLLTPSMQGKHHMLYYGFGPMFKYSHINASVTSTTTNQKVDYSLDDMNVGAVFDVGLAFEIGKYALRSDVKYYWEAKQYTGFGLAFQFEF